MWSKLYNFFFHSTLPFAFENEKQKKPGRIDRPYCAVAPREGTSDDRERDEEAEEGVKGMKKNALVVRLEEMQSSKSTAPKLNWNAQMVVALLKLRLWRQIPGN
jgi:hypothetical protein